MPAPKATTPPTNRNPDSLDPANSQSQLSPTSAIPGAGSMTRPTKASSGQTRRFSLRSWVLNASWTQYIKNGCRLIFKSPLSFFIFFCCLSVVVWGFFLLLLETKAVKLRNNDEKELWVEIASQVLNAIFTLANVPVHPKRFLGFIRGFSIWKKDRVIRQEFVARFLDDHISRNASTGSSKREHVKELLEMFDFYRCFPDYGRYRITEQECPEQGLGKNSSQTRDEESFPCGTMHPMGNTDGSSSEHGIEVDIEEDELNELLSQETNRVVHSAVLPFLPFQLDMSGNAGHSSLNEKQDPQAESSKDAHDIPLIERGLERGSSRASLSRTLTKRSSRRTKARTMSMVRDASSNTNSRRLTFMVQDNHRGFRNRDPADNDPETRKAPAADKKPPQLTPMPAPLTKEQMDWIDEQQERLLQQQERLQKAWPWYHYILPVGVEPVDFIAPPEQQPATTLNHGSPIMLTSQPTKLVMSPARFCVVMASFNLSSIFQEILSGFMWGVNYHVRPSWVLNTGAVLGTITGIMSTVMIVRHERAISRVRVVAAAEEAIQDVIDEKKRAP
ncbi:hypothetical protein BGX31_004084 [Mortierella sp. GBA43]|nr:hypothetical protein BGX31_004084 [Mortierella sp. GBA43]